jgi:hypothetical protein
MKAMMSRDLLDAILVRDADLRSLCQHFATTTRLVPARHVSKALQSRA